MAHKPRTQFIGRGVGEIRTSLLDDAEDGFNLDRREIRNFGEFHELSFVLAKPSIARMQLTL